MFRIPLSFVVIAILGWGVVGVWYAVAFSFVASAVTTGAWFLRGTWTDDVGGATDVDAPGRPPGDAGTDDD